MTFYEYFQSERGGFWQWEDGGEVLAIPGGSTIAYRDWVIKTLNVLAPQGIPSFGTFLLVVIATNPNAKSSLDTLDRLWLPKMQIAESVLAFLKRLSELPPEYKTGRKRIVLLQALFADSHNLVSHKRAKNMLRQFREGDFDRHQLTQDQKPLRANPLREWHTLILMSQRFPTNEQILQAMAGLPDLPDDLELEPQPAGASPQPTNDFLDSLLQDPRTFEVGALVKQLWSGLALTFHDTLPSQQPIGGVSDLTNKGELHQLLLTEWANEDLIFLSRLANSEALYLNREVPPVTDNRERVLLLDVSLKNWGTPKTVAFAVAVAIAHHPKAKSPCLAFALGDGCYPIQLDTAEGVLEGLQYLSTSLHPETALTDYFNHHAPAHPSEVFLISSEASLRHPAMQYALSQYADRFSYQILTDSAGQLSLYRQQRSGRRRIQEMLLPLPELWKNKPKPAPKAKPDRLEAINRPIRYPILFPSNRGAIPAQMAITEEENLFEVREKQLFQAMDRLEKGQNGKGWMLINTDLPFIPTAFEAVQLSDQTLLFLCFKQHGKELFLLELQDYKPQFFRRSFPDWNGGSHPGFIFIDGWFYYFNNQNCWAIAVEENQLEIICDHEILSPKQLEQFYHERQTRIMDLIRRWPTQTNLLKNVNQVGITSDGNLILNSQHQLKLTPSGKGSHKIKLKLNKTTDNQNAEQIFPDQFAFADGSRVVVNRAGMLVLVSSDPAIPVIYVPLVLDSELGLATEEYFAGNEYYNAGGFYNPQLGRHHQPTVMLTNVFWDKFVQPFVQTILQHGVST